MTAARLPVALVGAGAVGRLHAQRLQRHADVQLAGVADPTPQGRAFADSIGAAWFAEHRALLDATRPGAVLVATPNDAHASVGLDAIARGLPLLVEKPIAATLADAQALCDAADAAGVPLLVGHQRRHSVRVRMAKAWVDEGRIGRVVAAHAMATWLKPDSYFDLAWRRQPGAGPVLINLIHDIDLLRHLVGDVVSVQAATTNGVRGFAVEDTAAVLLRFASGALATLLTSDVTPGPWCYDLAAGENDAYPRQDVDAITLCGTAGSLTLPNLDLWQHPAARGWHETLARQRAEVVPVDPYDEQLRHLRAVAEGREPPLCSGRDAMATLKVALAVHQAAAAG